MPPIRPYEPSEVALLTAEKVSVYRYRRALEREERELAMQAWRDEGARLARRRMRVARELALVLLMGTLQGLTTWGSVTLCVISSVLLIGWGLGLICAELTPSWEQTLRDMRRRK